MNNSNTLNNGHSNNNVNSVNNGNGYCNNEQYNNNNNQQLTKPRILSPCKIITNASNNAEKPPAKDMEDLIHLPGPLTEDAVMRTLQARFSDGKHFVSIDRFFFYIQQLCEIW